jgi:acyl transferase domain-containing protein
LSSDLRVAVIGSALRVPGAADVAGFWERLLRGEDSISRFSVERLRAEGIPAHVLDDPDYIRAKGVLEDADCFDAEAFGIAPSEARLMDPQHRVFLEACWQALENAGHPARPGTDRSIGVFGGARMNQYAFLSGRGRGEDHTELDELDFLLGNDKDYLCSRVSYHLGLTGPSVVVQSACSSSLVAVSLAAQSLLTYQCDMALAGGVRVSMPLRAGYRYTPEGISSPDGRCHTFDAKAAGTVFGDGVGVVLLKRYEDAVADGDPVDAVITGFAVNNDGSAKASWMGPSMDAQAEVVLSAMRLAEADPATMSYVEAHGTGTQIGDPIEVAALSRAYGLPAGDRVLLGAVKPNIGHLSPAAGIASLIKAIQVVRTGVAPPSIHYTRPNPHLELEASPFHVSPERVELAGPGDQVRVGVSSFGMGGTNCHLVLERPEVAV